MSKCVYVSLYVSHETKKRWGKENNGIPRKWKQKGVPLGEKSGAYKKQTGDGVIVKALRGEDDLKSIKPHLYGNVITLIQTKNEEGGVQVI